MPSAAGSGIGFVGFSVVVIAALTTFSLHKIDEGLCNIYCLIFFNVFVFIAL